ncbi:MAG: HlyD family type I secretion periplasmic adaptor subunit [Rhodoferax sp.]|nr:HlyD family type I secretion periplasmic adaptor subunit [Rhodoferax sp.]
MSVSPDPESSSAATLPGRAGLWLVLGGTALLLVWAGFAPLDEGVPTQGLVSLDTKRKTVQHLQGGMVREVLVREGDRVQAEQVLMRLEPATVRANQETVRQHYWSLRAAESRLEAEQRSLPRIQWHPDLQSALQEPAVQPHLQVQTQLFESRKSSFDANQAGLRANLAGLLAQREGGARMLIQRQRQLALFNEELGNIQELVKEGYAPRNRALELQRNLADTSSTIADLESNDQKIQRSIDEMKQRLEQGRASFQAEVAAQLAEVRRDVQSDAEKLRAVSQDMEHIDIRSPASGQVVGLSVQTVGGVISPGQRLMDIVPEGAPLVVEARIPPHIVDRVKPGLQADVRFSAFAHSPQLTVAGTVQSVSQDVLVDPDTRQSYFLARIQLTPEGLAVLGSRTMQAGMSAEVVIRTGERTVLQYLLHPLVRRLAQSMKEE